MLPRNQTAAGRMFKSDTSGVTQPRAAPPGHPGAPRHTQQTIARHLGAKRAVETQGTSGLGGLLLRPALEKQLDGQPQGKRPAGSPHLQHSEGLPRLHRGRPLPGKLPAGGEDGPQTARGSGHFRPDGPPRQAVFTLDRPGDALNLSRRHRDAMVFPPSPPPFRRYLTAVGRAGVKPSPSE